MELKGSNAITFSSDQLKQIIQDWLVSQLLITNPITHIMYYNSTDRIEVVLGEIEYE